MACAYGDELKKKDAFLHNTFSIFEMSMPKWTNTFLIDNLDTTLNANFFVQSVRLGDVDSIIYSCRVY